MLTGRPYAVGWALDRCAAVVQAFFPGEEGGPAVAGVLSGRVTPSGRLPVSMPRSAGSQPFTYLRPRLGGDTEVTSLSSAPALPFGHGLSYTEFRYEQLTVHGAPTTDAGLLVSVRICNAGAVAGDDVVQLYGHDTVASVTRPVAQLLGYRRVHLRPGEGVVVRFRVPPGRLAFTARDGRRVVEPGALELWVGTSADRAAETSTVLEGPVHPVTTADGRWTVAE
jgi:beta-glucosidase